MRVMHVESYALLDECCFDHLRHCRIIVILRNDHRKAHRVTLCLEQGFHASSQILRPLANNHDDSNSVPRCGVLQHILCYWRACCRCGSHNQCRGSAARRPLALGPLPSAFLEGPGGEEPPRGAGIRGACQPATPPRLVRLHSLSWIPSRAAVADPPAIVIAPAAALNIVPTSEIVGVATILRGRALWQAFLATARAWRPRGDQTILWRPTQRCCPRKRLCCKRQRLLNFRGCDGLRQRRQCRQRRQWWHLRLGLQLLGQQYNAPLRGLELILAGRLHHQQQVSASPEQSHHSQGDHAREGPRPTEALRLPTSCFGDVAISAGCSSRRPPVACHS
mmetsp:Transcript_1759/g.4452  ORF Transcript_1759/g.4452 Transcript_1759/m.4452 type:complete len:335 (-) Transcript_1759:148-1152(-)